MCIALLPLTEILLKTVKALVSRHPQNVKKLSVNAAGHLCISQFHLRPAHPPPPLLGNCGAFARLVSTGGGAFANVALPVGRVFANPRAIPELLTRTRFPIRI